MDRAEYRRLQKFIEPCLTPEDLDEYIITNFGIELPWDIVDERSTSSSLKFLWDVNYAMLTNQGINRHVLASARNGGKTLVSSMIQFLAMVHYRRTGLHLAATLDQSRALIKYIDKFLKNPLLQPYNKTDNVREKILQGLPANDFTTVPDAALLVATATKKGTNSQRSSCLDGKTQVLKLRASRRDSNQGRYEPITMKGIYDRFGNGEDIFVASVNPKTGAIEEKKITNVFRNLKLDRLKITTESGKEIHCTHDHVHSHKYEDWEIQYKQAGDMFVGDTIMVKAKGANPKINEHKMFNQYSIFQDTDLSFKKELISVEDFLEGSLLGDGGLYLRKFRSDGSGKEYKGNAFFYINKTSRVRDYLEWASELLAKNNYSKSQVMDDYIKSGYTSEFLLSIRCKADPRFTELHNKWFPDWKKVIPRDLEFTWGKFAVWLMDDGNEMFRRISTHSFTDDDIDFLCSKINDLVGYNCAGRNKETKKDGRSYSVIDLHWPDEHLDKLLKLQNYIHDVYKYKFTRKTKTCKHCKMIMYSPLNVNVCNKPKCRFEEFGGTLKTEKIVSIERYKEKANSRNRWVYDITVEGNHNFFANQILTHNCLTFDEVDLTPREILSEAAFIADPSRIIRPDGSVVNFDPIFIYLSSRKTNDGPIQDLIDEAESAVGTVKTEDRELDPIMLHKWSTVDWMEKCSDKQHKPESGPINAYVHSETLQTIWGDVDFEAVPAANKPQYEHYVGYEGCKKCPAWTACLGRSVKQRGLSPMLRTRKFIGTVVRAVKDAAQIIAQALNWKPESTGLAFKNFSANHHIKDPRYFYEWVTFGEIFNPINLDQEELERRIQGKCSFAELREITPTKDQIYDAMVERGWTIISGVDWGFTDPAVCVVLGYHKKIKRIAVLHVDHAYGHANHIWAKKCSLTTLARFPVEFVAPDQADPSSVTYFAKYKIRSLQRGSKPSQIITGISFLRGYLWDAVTSESRFSILDDGDDEGCNIFMIEEMRRYANARDPMGRIITNKFEDENNHSIDALRYALHPYTKEQSVEASANQSGIEKQTDHEIIQDIKYGSQWEREQAIRMAKEKERLKNQMKEFMFAEHGVNIAARPLENLPQDSQGPKQKKKPSGGIKFSIS